LLFGKSGLAVYYILCKPYRRTAMSKDKKVKSCESQLRCKSTASLQKDVEQDLNKADGSLKELLENEQDTKGDCENK